MSNYNITVSKVLADKLKHSKDVHITLDNVGLFTFNGSFEHSKAFAEMKADELCGGIRWNKFGWYENKFLGTKEHRLCGYTRKRTNKQFVLIRLNPEVNNA